MDEGSVSGMGNVVSSLVTELSADKLWGVFAEAIPIIGVTVLVALGFYLIKKAIKKASKAKAGV